MCFQSSNQIRGRRSHHPGKSYNSKSFWTLVIQLRRPATQVAQRPNTFSLTPISSPSSHLYAASSPWYFQTISYKPQYFPRLLLSALPQHHRKYNPSINVNHSTMHHILSRVHVPVRTGNVQYVPSYAPQQTAYPQQCFQPPPPLPPSFLSSTTTYTSQISAIVLPSSMCFPQPPSSSSYSSTAPPQASLSTSPHSAVYSEVRPLSFVMLIGSQPHEVPYQSWPGVSTHSLPNPHMNAHSS